MSKTTVLNLDAKLGFYDEVAPQHTRIVKLFGREWEIVCDLNSFALSNVTSGDPAAVVNFILGVISPTQRTDFSNAISAVPNLTAEKLGAILNALVEVAAERPTTPPSVSRPTVSSRTSGRKSAASSGKAPVARLTS